MYDHQFLEYDLLLLHKVLVIFFLFLIKMTLTYLTTCSYILAEDERHDGADNDWINNVASTIKGFGGSLRSLTRALSKSKLQKLN